MYQNDTLQLIQHEEGRIVPKAGGWDYQYHLRDHLGNVRVTFSTRPEVYEMTEDFEGGENGFASLHPHTHLAANTTTDGNKVEILQSGQIGAMTLLSVNKGDSINLTVNANYETTPSGNDWLETAHSVLFNAFNTSYGEVIEGGVATSEWSDALHGVHLSPKHETSDAPRAFLNYILFDQNMNYVTAGFEQLSTAAQGVGVHETLSMDGIVAEQEGYILAYLSNENAEPVNVHFDDFTVTQTKTRVVSSQDYYPFGGTFNSFTRNYSEPQRFKYNGKELEEETGWSDFGARQYDRWSGRWMGMDPLGDLRNWVSPYNFVQNNPINRVDPDGALDREIRSLTAINRVERIDGEEMMDNPIYNEDGNFLGTDDIYYRNDKEVKRVKNDKPDRHYELVQNDAFGTGEEAVQISDPNGGESSDFNALNVVAANVTIWSAATSIAIHGPKPRYTGVGDWSKQVNSGAKFGRFLGGAGLILTAVDMRTNGVNTSNSLDAAFGVISFMGAPGAAIGGTYFGANMITVGITGQTIGEHVDNHHWVIAPVGMTPTLIPIRKR